MKKWLAFALALLVMCGLTGCIRKTYEVRITIPAGNTAEYVFADVMLEPNKDSVTLSAVGVSDTEVMLKGTTSSATAYLTKGLPAEVSVNAGERYQLGVSVQNPSDQDIYVIVKVKDAALLIE